MPKRRFGTVRSLGLLKYIEYVFAGARLEKYTSMAHFEEWLNKRFWNA